MLLLTACCSCGKTTDSTEYPRSIITFSSGGGVSAQVVGYTIDEDGQVTKWSGFAGKRDRSEVMDTLDEMSMRNVLRIVYSLPLGEMLFTETGNMTSNLEIVSDELLYRYSWPGTLDDATDVPAELRALRDALFDIVSAFPQYE